MDIVGALQRRGRLVEVVLADVSDHHLHARLQERAGHAEADAAGAAGDEGGLVLDVFHRELLRRSVNSRRRRSAPRQ